MPSMLPTPLPVCRTWENVALNGLDGIDGFYENLETLSSGDALVLGWAANTFTNQGGENRAKALDGHTQPLL